MLEKHYGMIVIGGGMAGLSSALAWAKTHDPTESPVLLLEKEHRLGGCVTTFARKGYRFDTVQIIPDIADLLAFFELDIDLVRYQPCYARLFLADPNNPRPRVFPIASSRDAFEEDLVRCFPGEAERIRAFFDYGQALLDELAYLKTEPNFKDILSILKNCPKILKNSNKTYKEYLEGFHFRDEELVEVLDTFSSFSGLSGNRAAALLTACAMMTTLKGAWRPAGGFIRLPHDLGKKLLAWGGTIRTGAEVDEILIHRGRAAGVRCCGEIYRADHVVSTADSFATFGRLMNPHALKARSRRYHRRLGRAVSSPSSFTVHLGLDDEIDLKALGFDCGYNVLTTGRAAHEEAFRCWERGEPFIEAGRFHLAVISPSAATGGKNTLVIHVTPEPMADWERLRHDDYSRYRARKEERARAYIGLVETYMIPDLSRHIRYLDAATPATYARYLGTVQGANSDMLAVPSNFGKNRLPTRTPFRGLFLPKFSHGIWPSLQAGLQVVDMITGGEIMGGLPGMKPAGIRRDRGSLA